MNKLNRLGQITLSFAMALLKEQEKHPRMCFHCNFQLKKADEKNKLTLVHEGGCPVNYAHVFLSEFNKGLIQN